MKKNSAVVIIVGIAIGAAGLTACSASYDATDSAASEGTTGFGDCEILTEAGSITLDPAEAGTLTVQTTLPAPGWWDGESPSTITSGYEYCLAANLANMAGLDSVTVQNVSFDQLVAGRTSKFDLALAGITITPERAEVVDFSFPYFDSDLGILTKTDAGVTQDNIDSKSCGAYTGTTAVAFIKDELSCEAKIYPNTQALYQAVLSGQIDAAFLDTAAVLAQAKSTDGALSVVGQYKTGEQYGALYPKGSSNGSALDEGLQMMIDDGINKELQETYLGPAFGGDPASVPIWNVG